MVMIVVFGKRGPEYMAEMASDMLFISLDVTAVWLSVTPLR